MTDPNATSTRRGPSHPAYDGHFDLAPPCRIRLRYLVEDRHGHFGTGSQERRRCGVAASAVAAAAKIRWYRRRTSGLQSPARTRETEAGPDRRERRRAMALAVERPCLRAFLLPLFQAAPGIHRLIQVCRTARSRQRRLSSQTDTQAPKSLQFVKRGQRRRTLSRDCSLFQVQDSTSLC